MPKNPKAKTSAIHFNRPNPKPFIPLPLLVTAAVDQPSQQCIKRRSGYGRKASMPLMRVRQFWKRRFFEMAVGRNVREKGFQVAWLGPSKGPNTRSVSANSRRLATPERPVNY